MDSGAEEVALPPRGLLRGLLAGGETVELTVRSESMAPRIQPGDQVRVVATHRVLPGDVVLLQRDTMAVIHRVILPWPRLLTKGDALVRWDSPGRREDVLGRVVAAERNGAWQSLPRFPRTLPALAAAVARPPLAVMRKRMLR